MGENIMLINSKEYATVKQLAKEKIADLTAMAISLNIDLGKNPSKELAANLIWAFTCSTNNVEIPQECKDVIAAAAAKAQAKTAAVAKPEKPAKPVKTPEEIAAEKAAKEAARAEKKAAKDAERARLKAERDANKKPTKFGLLRAELQKGAPCTKELLMEVTGFDAKNLAVALFIITSPRRSKQPMLITKNTDGTYLFTGFGETPAPAVVNTVNGDVTQQKPETDNTDEA
jgi:hypothetical protein